MSTPHFAGAFQPPLSLESLSLLVEFVLLPEEVVERGLIFVFALLLSLMKIMLIALPKFYLSVLGAPLCSPQLVEDHGKDYIDDFGSKCKVGYSRPARLKTKSPDSAELGEELQRDSRTALSF